MADDFFIVLGLGKVIRRFFGREQKAGCAENRRNRLGTGIAALHAGD
jgi:hypothetical protein